jgi:2-amino-4-hydroxy-6-hydroxymethyldihydropteridine diphosphokinase
VDASLADQPGAVPPGAGSIAIALGANLGDPAATLIAVRPLLAEVLARWFSGHSPPTQPAPKLHWSPLFRTEPVGGPAGQPAYLNGAVVMAAPTGLGSCPPERQTLAPPLALLEALQALEAQFGRQRLEHWGPRSLDLDLLWCGDLCCTSSELDLPHPRLLERSFVLAPLTAIDPNLIPPVQPGPPVQPNKPNGVSLQSCSALLSRLLPQLQEEPPERLPPRHGWPE